MSYSLMLARRLSLGHNNRRNAPAVTVAVCAVALSIAVMLAAVAVVLGFKREIRNKVIGFNAHITLYNASEGEDERNVVSLTPSLTDLLENAEGVEDYSLEMSMPAILKTPHDFKGIYLKSLNGAVTRDFIAQNLEEGTIPDFTKEESNLNIVISRTAARQLGLKLGDKIDTYFISDNVRVRRMTVAGIYNSHFESYDKVMAYGALNFLQDIAGISKSEGTSIQIATSDFNQLDRIASNLHNNLIDAFSEGVIYKNYRVDTALNQGAGYFQWLSLLDTNAVVILSLMTLVAIATLISAMLILILDKKGFIGIVRALGATMGGVRKVFVYLALKIALIGMLIGNVVMLGLLFVQDYTHFIPLDADAYYIDFVPVELSWQSVLLLNVGVFLVVWCALLIPSRFVASISPALTTRDE